MRLSRRSTKSKAKDVEPVGANDCLMRPRRLGRLVIALGGKAFQFPAQLTVGPGILVFSFLHS